MKLNDKRILTITEENNNIKSGSKINDIKSEEIKQMKDYVEKLDENDPNILIVFTSELKQLNKEIFQNIEINDFDYEQSIINYRNEEDEEIKNQLFNLIPDRE